MISAQDQARLAQAIGDVEDDTSGEVVLVIAEQAGHYRAIPLLWALLAALATPWPLLWLTAKAVFRPALRKAAGSVEEASLEGAPLTQVEDGAAIN